MKKKIIAAVALSIVISASMTIPTWATQQPLLQTEGISETSNSLATNYFLFKNIWGGEALKLAFNPETMQIQATARSGNFSNADQNLTLSIIDSESAQILVEEVANTKYVADFVTKINGKTFKYGDILALNIHADSKLSNPTLYGTDKNSSANCIGKNQYFQITPDGIVNYTANIHVEPLEILGQGVVHSTVLTGQTYTNAEVSVSVDGQTFTAQANDDGVFTVEIHSQPGFNAHTIIRVNVGGFEVSVNPQLLTAKNLVQQTNTGYSYVLNADLETLTTPFADHVLYGRSLLSDEGKKAWDLAYRLLLNYDNSADEYPRDGSGNVRFYVDYAAHGIEITKTEAQYIQKYLVVNEPRMFLLKDWSASPVYENGVIVGQNFYIGNSAQNGNDYQQQLLETEVVVSGILSKITPDMSVYQILKTLQKEYQRVVRYENAGTPGDIRGPFIGLNAVCGGYAKGYEYLLQRVGIQATWVSGDTSYGYHAWNNINLYGSWYLTDTTWGTHLNGTNQITNHHPRNTYHVMPTLQAESIPAGLGDLGQTIAELTGVVDYEYHADGTMTVTYADPNALNTQVEIHTSQNEYNPIAMEKTQAGLWTVTIPVASESEETLDFFFTVNNQFKTIGNIQVNDLALIDYDNGMKNIIVATLNVDKATLTELIAASNYAQADYTPTSFANYTLALDNAKAVVADDQATAITIAKAYRELQAEINALVKANVVEFKGYNNVVFLTLKFDATTQQLQAESNGQMVHPYQYSKVYAKVDHFDQQGKLKATYSVKANQTADEMAAALNGTKYVAGDYLQFSHLEKNSRLVINGYVENAPYDLSTGARDLDLTTAYFYLGGESFMYVNEQLDVSADKTELIAAITAAQAISGDDYTATSFANLQVAITNAQAVVETISAFETEISEAIATLTQAQVDLRQVNKIVFKGYNNNEFLTVGFDPETQQLTAVSNGQVANRFMGGNYAQVTHFDKKGNVKGTYTVKATQTADEVAAALNGVAYATGDYLTLFHAEKNSRLVINGYVENAPYDLSTGARDLDLTTAYFYLGAESFAYANEQLDVSADKTELIAAITAAQAISGADYTATSFANLQVAITNAQVVSEGANITEAEISEAIAALTQAQADLRQVNVVEFKGYNNVVFLTLKFDATTQQLQAESNGQMVHPYQYSKVYVKVDHFDQKGNLKATYSVKANQTADEMAAALNGTQYVAGDYLQFSHLEKNNRLVIKGYVENAPYDLSTGARDLDLTTAYFYLGEESFAYTNEQLDLSADKSDLIAAITAAQAISGADYTATSFANLQVAITTAQVVSEGANITEAEISEAIAALTQAQADLRQVNKIVFKGYNNNEFLTVGFNSETQQLTAVSNGQVANQFMGGNYAQVTHFDQKGNVKGTYTVKANQTADEVAAALNGVAYATGDYLTLFHAEKNGRLVINGYVENAPYDLSTGARDLDLTTAYFYLGEESFVYTDEQRDLSADKTELIAAITAAQAISGDNYTATSFANLQAAIIAAETLVTTPNVFTAEITEAIQALQAVVDELRVINVIEFKGYNNVVFLTLAVDQENQTFKAESNGQMVHPYQYSKVYVKVDHFDQQGNLKATYSVKADQTADEMASQLNAASIEQGDYIKLGHLEQNSRLAITGYIEGLESDLSQGVGTLDLQTAAFDLSGENLAYQIK